jgi:hypothetical protein
MENKDKLSYEEEALMWTSYRYSIGRHTYVAELAYYMAEKYYNLLSDERMEFSAEDIRREILSHLENFPGHVEYDFNVSKEDRRPLEDMLQYWSDNSIDTLEKILSIDKIEIYHEGYAKGLPHKYRVVTKEPNTSQYMSQMEIDDLIPWANLASVFDKKNYKLVHSKYKGKEYSIVAFESWHHACKQSDDKKGFYQDIPWKYEKIYVPVDKFVSGTKNTTFIDPDTIISVEDYDGTKKNDE